MPPLLVGGSAPAPPAAAPLRAGVSEGPLLRREKRPRLREESDSKAFPVAGLNPGPSRDEDDALGVRVGS